MIVPLRSLGYSIVNAAWKLGTLSLRLSYELDFTVFLRLTVPTLRPNIPQRAPSDVFPKSIKGGTVDDSQLLSLGGV